jgi:hypothetical protein
MNTPVFDVENAALALSDDQRADLAFKLRTILCRSPGGGG